MRGRARRARGPPGPRKWGLAGAGAPGCGQLYFCLRCHTTQLFLFLLKALLFDPVFPPANPGHMLGARPLAHQSPPKQENQRTGVWRVDDSPLRCAQTGRGFSPRLRSLGARGHLPPVTKCGPSPGGPAGAPARRVGRAFPREEGGREWPLPHPHTPPWAEGRAGSRTVSPRPPRMYRASVRLRGDACSSARRFGGAVQRRGGGCPPTGATQ